MTAKPEVENQMSRDRGFPYPRGEDYKYLYLFLFIE